MNRVDEKIKELNLLSTSGFDTQQQEFGKWEIFRHTSSASNAGSMRSLQSIASSLSRLEARFPAPVADSSDVLGDSSQHSLSHMSSQSMLLPPSPSPRNIPEGIWSSGDEDKSPVTYVSPKLRLKSNAKKPKASFSSYSWPERIL